MPYLFDKLAAEFSNGISIAVLPKRFHRLYSVMGYLQRTFRTRLGSVQANKWYGMPVFGDAFAKVPARIKEDERLIRDTILQSLDDAESVRVGHWTLHKKAYLQCVISLRLKNGEKFKFRLNLIGSGAHTVEVWSNAFM